MPFTFKLSQRLARMHARGSNDSAACRRLSVAGPRLPEVPVLRFTGCHNAVSAPLTPRATALPLQVRSRC